MEIDIARMHDRFRAAQREKRSRHDPADRVRPSRLQYDYLTLSRLSADVRTLVRRSPAASPDPVALDLGSDKSPYRDVLEDRGYRVRTLDITLDGGADYEGTAEATGLPSDSFDLVLCTQVLEHCLDPWLATREIHRILRPGGHAILSAPHVWFYHPHPTDHWRFTQEGLVRLCEQSGLSPVVLLAQGGSLLTLCQVVNFLTYGVLGRAGAPLYAAVNVVADLADRLVRNDLFCHNFACLAVKGAEGAPRDTPAPQSTRT
jgi:SAM-dependent methyltransferase